LDDLLNMKAVRQEFAKFLARWWSAQAVKRKIRVENAHQRSALPEISFKQTDCLKKQPTVHSSGQH
jgi:hypothetical protein